MVLQHNSPYFAPCEGVTPSRYFRRQTFISATPAMKRRLITPAENQRFSPGDPGFTPREKSKIFPAGTPAFLVLTALRHSGRPSHIALIFAQAAYSSAFALICAQCVPLRAMKMRRRSLGSSFLRNYRKALSFSCRDTNAAK